MRTPIAQQRLAEGDLTGSLEGPADIPSAPAPKRRPSGLLNTKMLGAAVVSLGGGLAAPAAFAPPAQACWSTHCRTYVSRSVLLNSREYGPWDHRGGGPENHAHYYDCIQFYWNDIPNNSYHYGSYNCGRSPWLTGPYAAESAFRSQGLAWRQDLSWAPGCGQIWARLSGPASYSTGTHIYGPC